MKWITELSIENYRAFSQKESVQIPFGSHLLIYGENGSGKSSIYNALRDFFTSSDRTSQKLETNYFEVLNGNSTGCIEIEITDTSNPPLKNIYKFSEPDAASTHRNIQELLLANKVKGFLDYKRLLKTYFVESPTTQNPDLFDLLVEDILADHKINRISGSSIPDNELSKQWSAIKTPLLKENYDGRKYICRAAKDKLPFFQNELLLVLTRVFNMLKTFMSTYFDLKLEINVKILNMSFNDSAGKINKGIFLEIEYAGQPIHFYHNFLNEARLSALATCIYLAALKTYPIDSTFKIRPLFLDDIFIGLDTSNRIPLLKLIKNEFINHGYQIFISTYDRQWFELARHWFTTENIHFKHLEMFVESVVDPMVPDKPVILHNKDNISRAKEHFKAKDYPAAGNYLRKECESIIWNLLPETYRIDPNGSRIQMLEPLLQQLEMLYHDSNHSFPQELINSLKIYRKLILNPSSHDNIESPLFKKEIEDAFRLAAELKNIPKIQRSKILDKNNILLIKFPANNYEMEITPSDNFFSYKLNSTMTFSPTPFKFFIKKWTHEGIEFGESVSSAINRMSQDKIEATLAQKRVLQKIFAGICHPLGIALPTDLESSVIISSSNTLRDLIN